jgi:hypothetical protein
MSANFTPPEVSYLIAAVMIAKKYEIDPNDPDDKAFREAMPQIEQKLIDMLIHPLLPRVRERIRSKLGLTE